MGRTTLGWFASSKYPSVPSFDKPNGSLLICSVSIQAFGNRRGGEVVERHEETYGRAVLCDEVLEEEELHVSTKATEEAKEG
jgi:hypothetical protein